MSETEIRLLGQVEATGPRGSAALTGTRRLILGVLALHAGEVVPYDGLVEVLWGESPPRTAHKTLHSHVARIRQALTACGAPPVLATRDPGYLLDRPREQVDAHRFEQGVAAARALADPRSRADRLAEALRLWRGEPFAGADIGEWGGHDLDRLRELRLSADEDRWDAEIAAGGTAAAALELPRLVARNPLRERLTGLLMLALHRDGRHAEALAAFQRLRERLADELGADPGPELSALHTAILRRDAALAPPRAAVPAQLPARVGHFTGRRGELGALDGVTEPIVAITGPAGMGKTALAIQWASGLGDRFPDGHLFLDLRGHDPDRAVPPAQALAHLLRGLDVAEDRIPACEAERAALYRTLLHGRRCVVVLDNAATAADVLPLVPGSESALLVVTSRLSLTALAAHHAVHQVVLDALDHASSVALLGKVLGRARVEREPEATAAVAAACGGMPLALRIAAARLAGLPGRPIADVAAELSGAGRLDGLAVDGDARTVRAVLASAYRPLPPAAARLLRLLGTVPGPTFTGGLGAALADLSAADCRTAFDALTAAHLLTPVGADRFRCHDLIGEFARDRAAVDEDTEEALDRLLDWHLSVADEANRLVNPDRDLVKPAFRFPRPPAPFADRHAAVAFLESERDNALPVVRLAAERGRPVAAWQLVYLLTSFHEVAGHWTERIELCRLACAAAASAADPAAEAEMLRALGVSYFMTRRFDEAVATNLRALTAVQAAGDVAGEGHVYNNLGNAYVELRRFTDAVDAFHRGVARAEAAENRLGAALSRRNLGRALVLMGRAADSLDPLTAALAAFDEIGNARLRAGTLDTLGEAHRDLGRHPDALRAFTEALAVCREIGDRWLEWELLLNAGRTHLAAGDAAAAVGCFARSLPVTRAVGDRNGEALALHLLGRAHLLAGERAAAAEHLRRALAARSAVPDPHEEAAIRADLAMT